MIRLEVQNTALKGKVIPLREQLTIGSGDEATIRAKGENMLPNHARFFREEDRFLVEIIDKEAHVFINGKDVLRSELRHNDSLRVGPLVFRIIDDDLGDQTKKKIDELMDKAEELAGQEVYDFAKEDLFYLANKDPMLRKNISFTIPSKDRFIDSAQAFLARMIKQSGMDELKLDAFITCAKELILNAHRHGHKFDESKKIFLRYEDTGDAIRLTIRDEGEGFDHRSILKKVREEDAAAAARKRYQSGGFGGLGFQMITRMADELKYNDAGNEVKFLVKKQFDEE